MSLICLFPGQGSQVKGMGADLFERYADWTFDDLKGGSLNRGVDAHQTNQAKGHRHNNRVVSAPTNHCHRRGRCLEELLS